MKAFIAGVLLAAGLATVAALVLEGGVQRTAEQQYQTGGVRL